MNALLLQIKKESSGSEDFKKLKKEECALKREGRRKERDSLLCKVDEQLAQVGTQLVRITLSSR